MTQAFAQDLHQRIARVLLGKETAIIHAITTLLAGGHLLIEDKPGVGKTLLARSLAKALNLPFQRVQCTADLLPSDILGTQIYHPKSGDVAFRPGPVFTSILLADELNRTPPRTQSALLEAMAERHVTIDRDHHALPDPFFVIATQNPISFSGTYPLPESQLDRFLMRIRLGYPNPEREKAIVSQEDGHRAIDAIETMVDPQAFFAARAQVDEVRVADELVEYMVALAQRSRATSEVQVGISTRGAQALHRACRARAVVFGRDFVVPDDVRDLIGPVFGHRLAMRTGASAEAVLQELATATATPD